MTVYVHGLGETPNDGKLIEDTRSYNKSNLDLAEGKN
jgi:hypothetical protein